MGKVKVELNALADRMTIERDAALLRAERAEGRVAELQEQTCARHADQVHGKEAEELRAGIEQILQNTADFRLGQPTAFEDVPASVIVGMRRSLQFLLDHIDARDSLAYLENRDDELAKVVKALDEACDIAAGESPRHAISGRSPDEDRIPALRAIGDRWRRG